MPPPLPLAERLGVTCRVLTEADMPFAAEVYASTRREEVAVTGWPVVTREAFLAQQHVAQHRHYLLHYPDAERLILERSGEPIGRLYLHGEAGDLHILDIALLPAARGMGIGGAILHDLLALAREAGQAVSIYVEKTNRARSLYDRLGFEIVEDAGVYDLMRARP